MELKKLSEKELIEEVERLKSENLLLKKEREKTLETVKILIAKISHEIKTPLNSIIGFGELFKYKIRDEKLSLYINNILTNSNYLLSLTQNLVDITRAQYKQMELSYSIFNTKDTIEEIISSFNRDDIRYTIIDATIRADYTRFKQLIYNLISNAIKYNNPEYDIEIITYVENNYFCFEITDYGDGIKEEDYENIFDIFSQVSEDLHKRQIGSGIGLALCKSIVEAHKGTIDVCSSINNGSVFVFKIPIDFKCN